MDSLGKSFKKDFSLFFNQLAYFYDYLNYYKLKNPIYTYDTDDDINIKTIKYEQLLTRYIEDKNITWLQRKFGIISSNDKIIFKREIEIINERCITVPRDTPLYPHINPQGRHFYWFYDNIMNNQNKSNLDTDTKRNIVNYMLTQNVTDVLKYLPIDSGNYDYFMVLYTNPKKNFLDTSNIFYMFQLLEKECYKTHGNTIEYSISLLQHGILTKNNSQWLSRDMLFSWISSYNYDKKEYQYEFVKKYVNVLPTVLGNIIFNYCEKFVMIDFILNIQINILKEMRQIETNSVYVNYIDQLLKFMV